MPILAKALYQGQPVTGGGTVFTVPSATVVIVTNIIVCNTTNAPAWISISRVPNGGIAGNGNRIMHQVPVAVGEVVSWDLASVMDTTGDFLWMAQQTANALTVTVSGVYRT